MTGGTQATQIRDAEEKGEDGPAPAGPGGRAPGAALAHGESLQQVAEEITAERAERAERGAQEDAAVAAGG